MTRSRQVRDKSELDALDTTAIDDLLKDRGPPARNTRSCTSTPAKETITTQDFGRSLGLQGTVALTRYTSWVWQHGTPEDLFNDPVKPDEVVASGAKLCAEKQSILEPLEALISERETLIELHVLQRDGNGKIDRNFMSSMTKLDSRSHIIDIILGAVNSERCEQNPNALGFVLHPTSPINFDNKFILARDGFTMFDRDLATPALTLYLPNELAATRFTRPMGHHNSNILAEISIQMRLHQKLQFQGLIFDGVEARLFFQSVARLPDILASHKTDISDCIYILPKDRNLFVADMVKLLRDHTDYRKIYTVERKVNRWNPRKGPYGDMVAC